MDGILHDAFDGQVEDAFILDHKQGSVFKGWRVGMKKDVMIIWLGYADDLLIVSETEEGLEKLMKRLDDAMMKWGMNVNSKKTKVMVMGDVDGKMMPKIVLKSGALDVVKDFSYLGSIVTADSRIDREVEERIAKASRTFERLQRPVWKRHELSLTTKMAIYRTCVLSSLLYGSETWTLLAGHTRRLEAFHHRCLRRIQRVSWMQKMTNEEIRKRAKMGTLDCMMRQRRLQWFGHIQRMDDDRLPKIILDSRPKDKSRPFTGSRTKWMDVIWKDMTATGIRYDEAPKLISDRKNWRTIIKNMAALVPQQQAN